MNYYVCIIHEFQDLKPIGTLLYLVNFIHQAFTLKMLVLFNMASFGLIIAITSFALEGEVRVKAVGWICAVFSLSVFAAPLSIVVCLLFFLLVLLKLRAEPGGGIYGLQILSPPW